MNISDIREEGWLAFELHGYNAVNPYEPNTRDGVEWENGWDNARLEYEATMDEIDDDWVWE